MDSLSQKVVLITGGSKGIGKAAAIEFASKGAFVVVNYNSDSKAADEVIQTIGTDKAIAIKADASTLSGIEDLVKQAVDRFKKIDVLVPNAGVLPMKDLEHTTEQDFDSTFATNVKGAYFLCQKALPYMAKGSHIILISSTLTAASTITPPYLLYAATKGAIEQMTRVLSKDLGKRGIFVNAVAPGPTGTELFYKGKSEELLKTIAGFNPHNRIGTPEEIAKTIVFLGEAPWVSGQVVRVNGGMA